MAHLVYYLYEPYLKAPNVVLDPSASVTSSPISSRGLRSGQPHERPKISYEALSTLDQVDFSKLIVFIDVSASMDMVMVSKVINSYFQSVFTTLKKNPGNKTIKAVVVLHGTNVGVFGITVHPHVRGDYKGPPPKSSLACGPSPRAWGLHGPGGPGPGYGRAIPTCVGTTVAYTPR